MKKHAASAKIPKSMSGLAAGALLLFVAASAGAQDANQDLKYGLVIHYGMPTFMTPAERGNLPPEQAFKRNGMALPVERFAPPETVRVSGWASAAKDAGMTFAILTAKHESGFCLWPAKDDDYTIGKSPYKGDIVRDFVKACETAGIAPGIQYSIPDTYNEGKARVKGMVAAAYFAVIKRHLTELHTQYPQLRVQFMPDTERLSPAQLEQVKQLVHRLNPKCVFWEGGWEGPQHVLATTLLGWFWRPQYTLWPRQKIENALRQAQSQNKAFLLNVGPAPDGTIPADQMAVLKAVWQWGEEMKIQQQGFLVGIGANLKQADGQVLIGGIFQNSPAEKAGLKAGQVITRVNGIPTAGMALADAVKLVRGPKGSSVELTVEDPATTETQQVVLVRDNIALPAEATGRIVDGNIGLLTVRSFSETTPDMVGALLRSFTTNEVQGIVLDLRNNGGGSLKYAVEVGGMFVGKKPTLFLKRDFTTKQVDPINATGDALWQGPLVVLVDGKTASAAELIASGLQTSGRAKVVGQKTFGQASVNSSEQQSDGTIKRVVIAVFLTAEGERIDGIGITPDITLEAKLSAEESLHKAVEVLILSMK